MDKLERPDTLPLDYAAQIAFELDAMRRECSEIAMVLLSQRTIDEANLEECARLDEALARANGILRSALKGIQTSRVKDRGNKP
jgi:hypothetical protein